MASADDKYKELFMLKILIDVNVMRYLILFYGSYKHGF